MADIKWIKICNDIFDDEKIILIESMPDADSLIVIWFKLLCLAGKQNNNGVFILNDRLPYTDEMLSTIFRRPVNTIRLAINTFEMYGMIEIIDGVVTIPNWQKHQNIETLDKVREQNRLRKQAQRERQRLLADSALDTSRDCHVTVTQENKNKKEKREEEKENIVSRGRAEAQTPTVIQLTTNKNEPYNITQAELDTFIECYPAVDIMQELRKMKAWLESNPTKRKTKGGMLRFVNNWLARKQDNGGTKRNGTAEQSLSDGSTAYNGIPLDVMRL